MGTVEIRRLKQLEEENAKLKRLVAAANLGNAALVAAAFNAEFAIAVANDEDTLLVVNATDSNSFALWHWVQAGSSELSAAETTLIGVVQANERVAASNFDFA